MRNHLKILLREGLLNEYEIAPYKILGHWEGSNGIRAVFKTAGLRYTVVIEHNPAKHDFGTFELSFSNDVQKHAGQRLSKDYKTAHKHVNNVLYTVMAITEEVVKKNKIQKIKIEGARDEVDTERDIEKHGERALYVPDNFRTKLYLRFLQNRYPSDAINVLGKNIYVDMSKVFPDIINSENSKLNKMVDLLLNINIGGDEEYIKRGINGENDDEWGISTDGVEHPELGTINFEISSSKNFGDHDVSWESYDTGEGGSEFFNSYDELYDFISNKFLNSNNNPKKDIKGDTNDMVQSLLFNDTNLNKEEYKDIIKNSDINQILSNVLSNQQFTKEMLTNPSKLINILNYVSIYDEMRGQGKTLPHELGLSNNLINNDWFVKNASNDVLVVLLDTIGAKQNSDMFVNRIKLFHDTPDRVKNTRQLWGWLENQ
jgi:hypothetical protein